MDLIDLDPKEWEILSMINGENSIRDIADKYGNEFEIAKLIYGMMTLGIVQVADRKGVEITEDYMSRGKQYYRDGIYDKSILEMKSYLKEHAGDAEAYVIICSSFYALRQYEKINDYAEFALKNGVENKYIHRFNAVAYYRRGNMTKSAAEWHAVQSMCENTAEKEKIGKLMTLLDETDTLTNELLGG